MEWIAVSRCIRPARGPVCHCPGDGRKLITVPKRIKGARADLDCRICSIESHARVAITYSRHAVGNAARLVYAIHRVVTGDQRYIIEIGNTTIGGRTHKIDIDGITTVGNRESIGYERVSRTGYAGRYSRADEGPICHVIDLIATCIRAVTARPECQRATGSGPNGNVPIIR